MPGRLKTCPTLAAQLLDALLPCHGLARPLAGARVGLGSLSAHRQAPAMPDAPVTLDVPQAGDILLHLPAERAFHRVLAVENPCQTADVVVGQLLGAALRIDARL